MEFKEAIVKEWIWEYKREIIPSIYSGGFKEYIQRRLTRQGRKGGKSSSNKAMYLQISKKVGFEDTELLRQLCKRSEYIVNEQMF